MTTPCPQELDEAVRRRLVKRIYIPLPDRDARRAILGHLLRGQASRLGPRDAEQLVGATEYYSASDLTALCKEAAMGPVRELGPAIASVRADRIRPLEPRDFGSALQVIKPSVNKEQLAAFDAFTKDFGTS